MRDDRLIELLRAYDEPVAPSPAFDQRLLATLRAQARFGAQPIAGRGRAWLRLPGPFGTGFPLRGGRVSVLFAILAILMIAALAAVIIGALRQLTEPRPPWRESSILFVDSMVAPAGWTIDTLASKGDVGGHPALAVGPDGRPVVAFVDASAGRVLVARCADATCSAIGPTADAGPVGQPDMTTRAYVSVGASSEVWVARTLDRAEANSAARDIRIDVRAVCLEAALDACSAEPVDLGPGQNPELRVRSDGRLVVLFGSLEGADSKLVVCGDPVCSSGNVVTDVPVAATERSMVIGAGGRPAIAGIHDGVMGVLSCLDDTCVRTTWAPVATARQPRIALGPGGLPVLAALSGRSLVLYRCADVICSAGSRSTLADLGPPAGGGDEVVLLDLALAPDGRAIASLTAAGELKVIGCLTVACDRAARFVLDHTSPDFAASHALSVDVTGRPFIAYAVRSDLAVARCIVPDCLAGTASVASPSASAPPTPSSQPSAAGEPVRTVADPDGGINPAVAIGADGRPVAVYMRADGVKVLHCGTATCDRGNALAKISSDNAYAGAIAIGRDGSPVLAYLDFDDSRLSVVRCHDSACSNAPSIEHPKVAADFQIVALAVPADDRPLIAFLDNASAELRLGRCADRECRTITSAPVDANGADVYLNSVDLQVAPDGSPLLGYAFANGVARIARCSDLDCSKPTVTTAGTAGIELDTAALGIGADGIPVLAFYSDGSLRVARCSDRSCKSVSSVRVDSATAKWWTPVGVGLGADGNPVIAYFSPTNLDTKLALCHDPACNSADLIALPGSDANGADDHTGVAFLPGGVPVFVYSRDPSLYAEVCTDPRCGA